MSEPRTAHDGGPFHRGIAGSLCVLALALALASASVVAHPEMPPMERLRDAYARAVMGAVARQWIRPDSVPLDVPCPVQVIQLPGGEVISARVLPTCPYDALGRASVERAVVKASPLPYRGFESLFQRALVLNFRASEAPATSPE